MTILFVDLVGFTQFAEGRDSEDVRDVQTRYFSVEGFATNSVECVGVAAGQFAREIAQVFAPRV